MGHDCLLKEKHGLHRAVASKVRLRLQPPPPPLRCIFCLTLLIRSCPDSHIIPLLPSYPGKPRRRLRSVSLTAEHVKAFYVAARSEILPLSGQHIVLKSASLNDRRKGTS